MASNRPYEGMKGLCPVCHIQNVKIHGYTGKLMYHRKSIRGIKHNCEGSGLQPLRITYDPAMQVAKIATLHESTVQNAPEITERIRQLKRQYDPAYGLSSGGAATRAPRRPVEVPRRPAQEDSKMAMRSTGDQAWCAYCHRYIHLKVNGKLRRHKPQGYNQPMWDYCPGADIAPLKEKPTGPAPFEADKDKRKASQQGHFTQQDMDELLVMAQEDAEKALAQRLAEIRERALNTVNAATGDADGETSTYTREDLVGIVAGLQLIQEMDGEAAEVQTAKHMFDGRWQTPTGDWLYTQQDMEAGLAEAKAQLEAEVQRAAALNKSNLYLINSGDELRERLDAEMNANEALKRDVLNLERRIQEMQDTEAQFAASQEQPTQAADLVVQRAVEDRDREWLTQLDKLSSHFDEQLNNLAAQIEDLRIEQRRGELRTATKPAKKTVSKKKLRKLALASILLEELEVL